MLITRGIFFLSLLLIFFVTPTFIGATKPYDSNDPSTWSSQELKEWLSEHRVIYKGIPEKKDLVCLVKNHKDEVSKTTKESVQDFVNYYIGSLKDVDYDARELTQDKYNEYSQKVASQIEYIRQQTHLTEEQVNSVFDQIFERLKSTKAAANKNLEKALYQIKDSYSLAKERRDAIIHDASSRIEKDLSTSKEVSQKTVDWFKEEIYKLNESGAFAKSRLGTQVSLILHGIQERLTQNKIATADQVNTAYDKLNAAVEDSYRSINGTLERIRKELYDSIGSNAETVVESIRNQLSTVNDYRLLTQEKIQAILDNIGQTLQDGKTYTVDQIQYIKDTIKRGFGAVRYYYSSATGQTKQDVYWTKDERLNKIIKGIQDKIQELKKKGDQKLSLHEIETDISLQQLNPGQARILSDVIKEQLGNLKNVRDLTEEKVLSFLNAVKVKLADTGEYLGESYDTVKDTVKEKVSSGYDTVNEGYQAAKNKASEGYEKASDKLGFDKMKEQLKHEKDEL
ncbi:6994_t:CDS:2 [Dentiscutata heterogama]|uniref:6994_t:CDS:1 n=1 Tax=Dentiscutata heterogama TaxID=1316150 RepID=A0ACA9KKK8_9GLOM|nr:6994_t:CDS:2 [Dentiscutata heterogama]